MNGCRPDQPPNGSLRHHGVAVGVGRRQLESVAPLHVEDVRALLFDHLTAEETKCLASALSKVAGNFCAHEHFQIDQ
ncbi:MAG: hypothetical protein ACI8TP_002685 [Acidimicrobiales bacterium]